MASPSRPGELPTWVLAAVTAASSAQASFSRAALSGEGVTGTGELDRRRRRWDSGCDQPAVLEQLSGSSAVTDKKASQEIRPGRTRASSSYPAAAVVPALQRKLSAKRQISKTYDIRCEYDKRSLSQCCGKCGCEVRVRKRIRNSSELQGCNFAGHWGEAPGVVELLR